VNTFSISFLVQHLFVATSTATSLKHGGPLPRYSVVMHLRPDELGDVGLQELALCQ
jgi:hypothetical protein